MGAPRPISKDLRSGPAPAPCARGVLRSLAEVMVNGARVPGLISMGPVLPALSGCILSVEDKVPRFRLSYPAPLTSSCGCWSSPGVGRHSATHRALQSCLFPPQLSTPRTIYLPHRILHGCIAPLQLSTRRVTRSNPEQRTVAYPCLSSLNGGCRPSQNTRCLLDPTKCLYRGEPSPAPLETARKS